MPKRPAEHPEPSPTEHPSGPDTGPAHTASSGKHTSEAPVDPSDMPPALHREEDIPNDGPDVEGQRLVDELDDSGARQPASPDQPA